MSEGTFKSYFLGFLISLALTLIAFFVVLRPGIFHLGSDGVLVVILSLAVVQFFVQALLFLRLASSSVWNKIVFVSTVSILLIIIIGSIWIMNHLNYNMMPNQMSEYLLRQEGF